MIRVIGWREWIALPELGVDAIKVKVDTGARTSSLHAFDLDYFRRRGEDWVRFEVHPRQRSASHAVSVEARVSEHRHVTSSNGRSEERPVIETEIDILGLRFPIEITLTRRDSMGFRMLLGRQAIRSRFLVDASGSFYGEELARVRSPRTRKPSRRSS